MDITQDMVESFVNRIFERVDARFVDLIKDQMTEENKSRRKLTTTDRIFPILQARKTEKMYSTMINAIGESCGWADDPFIDDCWNHWITLSSASADTAAEMGIGYNKGRQIDINNSSSMNQYLSLYKFNRAGSYVYDLSKDLTLALMSAECNFPGSMLKIPRNSYYVAVPRSVNITASASDGEYWLDGIHITMTDWTRAPGFDARTEIDDDTVGIEFNSNIYGSGKRTITWRVRKDQVKSLYCVAVFLKNPGDCMWDNFLVDFPVPLLCDNIEKSLHENSAYRVDRLGVDESVYRIAINSSMYIMSDGCDVKRERIGPSRKDIEDAKKGDKRAAKRVRDSTIKVSYHRVGGNIKLCDNTSKHMEQGKEERKLTSGHMVKGHWRTVLHGKGKTEKSPRFIQPHWRGPSFDDVIARIVKVK